jgi:5-methylcytosine-specific restriction endonuclease McrA
MSQVFVINSKREPLMPCSAARARMLLRRGKAAVWRRYPFTLILKEARPETKTQPLRLKIDPGAKTTGLAIVNDATGHVLFAAEVIHRSQTVRDALKKRKAIRRSRRQRNTRYRPPRFNNRRRAPRWLPPSQESRLANVMTWVRRLCQWCPITHLSMELVRFDMALMQKTDISGMEYQHGTLFGCEVRELLLTKWEHRCAYCGACNVPLEVEHIVAKSRGGSDRVSNLIIACHPCNQSKGNQPIGLFLEKYPDKLTRIQAQLKAPLEDAAAVNTTRWALYERLQTIELPVEVGTGGCTKWNRTTHGLPKTHWLDAVCVGASTPNTLHASGIIPLLILAMGRGNRQMCRMDRFGFPRTRAKQARTIQGFRTGDLVRAVVSSGKKQGTHEGRVAVRRNGSFNITTSTGTTQGISYRFCQLLQRGDGYRYERGVMALPRHV